MAMTEAKLIDRVAQRRRQPTVRPRLYFHCRATRFDASHVVTLFWMTMSTPISGRIRTIAYFTHIYVLRRSSSPHCEDQLRAIPRPNPAQSIASRPFLARRYATLSDAIGRRFTRFIPASWRRRRAARSINLVSLRGHRVARRRCINRP